MCHGGACARPCPLQASSCPCGKHPPPEGLRCGEKAPSCGDTCGQMLECGIHTYEYPHCTGTALYFSCVSDQFFSFCVCAGVRRGAIRVCTLSSSVQSFLSSVQSSFLSLQSSLSSLFSSLRFQLILPLSFRSFTILFVNQSYTVAF